MARVPTINAPSVAPGGQALPYGRPAANPAAFGGLEARALSGLGQQIDRAADQAEDIILRETALANDSTARDIATDFERASLDAYGSYASLTGRAAVEGLPAFQQDLRAEADKVLSTAANAPIRRFVKSVVDQQVTSLMSKASQHARQQNREWAVSSAGAAAQSSAAIATTFRYDRDSFHRNLASGLAETGRISMALGEDVGAMEVRKRVYVDQTVGSAIGVMLGDGRAMEAGKLFEQYRNDMSPEGQARIAQAIRAPVLEARADQIVGTAMTGGVPRGVNRSPVASMAYQRFRAAGYPEVSARALVGQIMAESGGDPSAVGDGGSAFGLMQWRGDRLAALQAFAAQKGASPADIATQLEFAIFELSDKEAVAGAALKAAQDLPSALDAAIGFERPAGWTAANPRGGHNYDVRAQYAREFAPAALPDRQSAVAQVLASTGEDPDLQRVALSRLNSAWAANEVAYGADRGQLEQTVKETEIALRAGQTVPIPEQQIRSTLPPADAEQVIGGLRNAQVAGQIYQSVKFAAPADIAQMRADLADGSGPLAAAIRSNLRVITDPATGQVVASDQAREFAARQSMLQAFDQQVERRAKALADDPAAYVASSPSVGGIAADLQSAPTPENWTRYAAATLAVQQQLGVPESSRAVLAKSRQQQILGTIAGMDPKGVAKFMADLQAGMGPDVWPRAFGDLQRAGLAPEYVALGLIDGQRFPQQRVDLVNVLAAEREKKGVIKAQAGEDAKEVAEDVRSEMADFLQTFRFSVGGATTADAMLQAATLLAWSYKAAGHGDPVGRAVSAITGQFDVMVSEGQYNALAPVGYGEVMADASSVVLSHLTAGSLAPLRDRLGIYSADDLANAALSTARNGVWVTSPSGDGWTLLGADGAIVRRRDGQPVTLTYDDAARIVEDERLATPTRMLGSDTGIVTAPSLPQAAAQAGITEDQAAENARKRADQRRKLLEGD